MQITIAVPTDLGDALADAGLLGQWDADNRDAIATAIERLLKVLAAPTV